MRDGKIIALYKKDIYLYKKMFIIGIISYIALLYTGLAMRFSCSYGNLRIMGDVLELKATFEKVFPAVTTLIITFEMALLPLYSIDNDLKYRFYMFVYSTDALEEVQTKVKILEIATTFALGLAVDLTYSMIFGIFFGFRNVMTGMVIGFVVVLFVCLLQCIILPVTYMLKKSDTAGGVVIIGVYAIAMGVTYYIQQFYYDEFLIFISHLYNINVKAFIMHHAGIITLITLCVIFVGLGIAYFGTLLNLKRRERLCGV